MPKAAPDLSEFLFWELWSWVNSFFSKEYKTLSMKFYVYTDTIVTIRDQVI